MNDYIATNRSLWNGWAQLHAGSSFYDVDGFKAGRLSLMSVELEELGDVAGQTLLHLQCHFGQDTLSWARKGAQVTGADLSNEAIALARSLSRELDIPAEFICANIYDLPQILERQFDIVYTSYGVLCWLPDLRRWAEIIAGYLKPGGTFYMVEFHPLMGMLDDETGERLAYPYFCGPEPMCYETEGSYAVATDHTHTAYEWSHGLGEVVTSLIDAGLTIQFLHEFPYSVYNDRPFLEESEPGQYVWLGRPGLVPLMYSVRATKPAR
ncbi:MAG: class I SAM-dependent methyltransferase [Chloroflexi bacterium]|nr:class I SAM-dependent methyltransferase [Chloroflexota bacterium]MBU1751595.1 class I SAM-dependent methyltransferase [Chloroflexota bacterium]MBU1877313.1 class I SAM-dependent methyltransferase [Chloroflexota bacterium]